MTRAKLIFESLKYHARSHLGVLLGAIIGSGILTGALVVGDSVRGSLKEFALMRLGRADLALTAGDRLFRDALATDLSSDNALGTPVAPVLQVLGVAIHNDNSARANQVQVLGVDQRFWELASQTPSFAGQSEQTGLVLNRRLADHLDAKVGDSILLRIRKPSLLSREAPVSPQEDYAAALRMNVGAIVSDEEFGRFSLQANQIPPYNAYLPLSTLQEQLEQQGRANLLLLTNRGGAEPISVARANETLQSTWKLADAELELRELPDVGVLELRSRRVFLDAPIVEAAMQSGVGGRGVLTYFVNELRVNNRSTPYSMVAGMENWPPIEGMNDQQIAINNWLAEDLQANAGDEISLTYYVPGESRRLEERTNSFQVFKTIPMEGEAADRELLPQFPGVAKAESTRDWDAGFPIDLSRVRDKDEAYWDDHRGTPKAFVTLAAAQNMWANRFGTHTAVRFPLTQNDQASVESKLLRSLRPSDIGLSFLPIREQALKASQESFPFGQLFIGFSFFLIIAALLLMALLFQFGVEQRAEQIGTLLALGFRNRTVRWLLLLEGCAIAILGSLIGMIAGTGYAKLMVRGLATIWREAVGTSALDFHMQGMTLLTGAVSGAVVCILVIWLSVRKQANQPVRELMEAGKELESAARVSSGKSRTSFWVAIGAFVLGAGMAFYGATLQGNEAAETFFGAGSLLLIAGIAASSVWFRKLSAVAARQISLVEMGLRGVTRRPKRSLTIVACLACGSFLIIAIEPFRLDANVNATARDSGTGGFAYFGETTVPVVHNLNESDGRDFYGLDESEMQGVSFVPMRVRDGDDASCLNLNRAQQPRLLGVNPKLLADRGAFVFSGSVADAIPPAVRDGWEMLDVKLDDGTIPAIGDINSIQWALGKTIGDTLTYTDEQGESFEVRLVGALGGSILQGSIVISEKQFTRLFPSISGYRMFLIDAPADSDIDTTLSRALRDVGLELTPATRRLAEFNAVQNTYLSTFQVLGGLGLVLGSVGLGVVVLRNVLERRSELALLEAVGFRSDSLRWLILSEHGALLLLGLAVGTIAAALAVGPILMRPENEVPLGSLTLTLIAIFGSGLLWTWLAATFALRGNLLDALRND